MSNLFEDIERAFPPVSIEEWKKGVAKALKGETFEKKLVVRTLEGLHIQPLYTRQDALASAGAKEKVPAGPGEWPYTRGFPQPEPFPEFSLRGGGSGWALGARVSHPCLDTSNTLALENVEGGVQTLEFPLVRASEALAEGLRPDGAGALWLESEQDLEIALRGVHWELAPVALCPQLGKDPASTLGWALELRNALVAKQNAGASLNEGTSGLFVQGDLVSVCFFGTAQFHSAVEVLGRRLPNSSSPLGARPFLLSSEALHGAGGTVVQEMAMLLSAFVALLRASEAMGMDRAQTLRSTEFRVAIASDFFTEIAKLRALRTCLGKVFEAVGLSSFAQNTLLSASTSELTVTRYEPYVNLLRSTEQTFAAVLGGATKILTLPFDIRVAGSTRFGHRLARNIQVILAEEAGAGLVADAAGGSWYVERRTEELAEAAWTLFREWEAKGGLLAVLQKGDVQAQVDAVWESRKKALHRRREPVLGVSEFPLAAETPPESDLPFDVEDFLGNWERKLGFARAVSLKTPSLPGRFPKRFLGDPFERLRDVSLQVRKSQGRTPHVFVAVYGAPASWAARLGWVKNLFAAAGVETIVGDASRTLTENVDMFRKSGATTVVLVSTDDLYEVCLPEFTAAFKAAGAHEVWVAGQPGVNESAWRTAGVNAFAHVGCDAHALLRSLLQSFGENA
ncbi:MAG: hypothetical protein IOD12_04495 [Silvanigrellales bacterium]|nr:hypothetical protein [Silvanigrellales bacterium]